MKPSEVLFDHLKQHQLIALLTPKTPDQCVMAWEVLNPLGIVLEVALRSEVAEEGIRATLARQPNAQLLAGTVMTRQQAEMAIQAGVAGIVSADYIQAVVDVCIKADVMCIPGGLSDAGKQLVQKAEGYGCSLEELREQYPYQWIYKLFPAIAGGMSNIELATAWKGPFKDLTVVYTGGISSENLGDVVRKDPAGIFCGSALTRSIEKPDLMKTEASRWVSIVRGL